MISHGTAPFLECSSKGDTRLSAFYARIKARGNRSIEEIYQGAKVFDDGSTGLGWREAKGRRATNMPEVASLYSALWNEYMAENPALLEIITSASGLADRFGQPGHCCQATELWRIRCTALGLQDDSVSTPVVDRPRTLSLFGADEAAAPTAGVTRRYRR